MKPEIQISHLKTLIAISEEGNFGAAAQRVGRTQSAVTQQMQNLEQIVNAPLFVAKGRQRELTEAGLTLLRYGREIVSLCNHAVTASGRSQQTGIIKIGAPYEIAEELLPGALIRFTELWRDMRVVIHVDRSPNLMEMLEEGRLDLTLSTRRSSNTESVLLIKMPVLWIAASGWEFDLSDPLPLILTDEPSMFRRIALSALDLSGQPYIERFTSPSMAGVRLAVSAGLGVTARTQSAFLTTTKILDERDGFPPLPDIPYYLHRPIEQSDQASKALFDTIVEEASGESRTLFA
ncbi:LysR substrate-binding domain-containing protein [Denitrobaculum tricleocarpae]|uniref:LysR family transcriptional regulator n=1 Tax=Denitrobaculum tricleocarpae TaxID=2591009 RepID=A0A545TX48_9PROT|nr:LysR substrate-binding domain-containing protein [Denitrobaculum tricleocarpae]TQV81799.1 LysR family transcriptional regulator [Denitrobaculum tricleocarpae]